MRHLLLTLSAIALFSSCSQNETPAPSREQGLMSGDWKLASGTLTVKLPNGKDTALDYMKLLPDCLKDDILNFDSVKVGKRLKGATACNAGDPDYVPFKWQFTGGENYLDLYNGFNNIYAISMTIDPYIVNDAGDTVREMHVSAVPAPNNNSSTTTSGFDINRAYVSAYSSSSFTINFPLITQYPDTTGQSATLPPVMRPDTFMYKLTYSK